jgi:hypothetical protein
MLQKTKHSTKKIIIEEYKVRLDKLTIGEMVGFFNVFISGQDPVQKLEDFKIDTGYAGEEGTQEEFDKFKKRLKNNN